MGSNELKKLHEQLEQQKQKVYNSPEAAQQLLEELGFFQLLVPSKNLENNTQPKTGISLP